jgi:hypothetical protein
MGIKTHFEIHKRPNRQLFYSNNGSLRGFRELDRHGISANPLAEWIGRKDGS